VQLLNENTEAALVYMVKPEKIICFVLRRFANDNLYIKVLSFDEKTYGFFNLEPANAASYVGSEASLNLYCYTVSESGYIDFPFVGEIYVKDLTLKEAKAVIEKQLKAYLNQTSVIVRFVSKEITILGEVNRPGKYPIFKDRINILQVIGLAGDVSRFGNRKRVTVIREIDRVASYHYLDLTDKRIVQSEFFFLKPNDIIYIEPLKEKQWGFDTFPYTLVLSSITTLITLLYFFQVRP